MNAEAVFLSDYLTNAEHVAAIAPEWMHAPSAKGVQRDILRPSACTCTPLYMCAKLRQSVARDRRKIEPMFPRWRVDARGARRKRGALARQEEAAEKIRA